MNDLELVNAAFNGDSEAFQQLYTRGDKSIRQAVKRVLKGSDAREDVVQDVWVQVLRKKHLFRGEAKFETWVYRVAWNCALLYIRTVHAVSQDERMTVSIEVVSQDSHWEPTDTRADTQVLEEMLDQETRLLKLLPALKGRYRQCVELRLQGLQVVTIARRLTITEGAVKSYLYRAVGLLQERAGLPAPNLEKFRAQTRAVGIRARERARAARV